MRKGIAILATAAVAVSATIVGISAASAAEMKEGKGVGACPMDKACLYERENFNYDESSASDGGPGRILILDVDNEFGRGPFDAKSLVNNTRADVVIYPEIDFHGEGRSKRGVAGYPSLEFPVKSVKVTPPPRKFRLTVDSDDDVLVKAQLVFKDGDARVGEGCALTAHTEKDGGLAHSDVCSTDVVRSKAKILIDAAWGFTHTTAVVEPLKPLEDLATAGDEDVIQVCYTVYKKYNQGTAANWLWAVQKECSGPEPVMGEPMNNDPAGASTHLENGAGNPQL